MHTRTKYSLQSVIEDRVLIEILSESRAWFFGMNQAYLHTLADELSQLLQERDFLTLDINVCVFDVSSAYPKCLSHALTASKDMCIVVGI